MHAIAPRDTVLINPLVPVNGDQTFYEGEPSSWDSLPRYDPPRRPSIGSDRGPHPMISFMANHVDQALVADRLAGARSPQLKFI